MNYVGISTFGHGQRPGRESLAFLLGLPAALPRVLQSRKLGLRRRKAYDEATEESLLKALEEPFVEGLSLLGGDPLEPENEPNRYTYSKRVREKFGSTKTIWLWTGRKYEHVKDLEIFKYVDVVVDGPFIERLKVEEQGKWFGSTNQRIICLQKNCGACSKAQDDGTQKAA